MERRGWKREGEDEGEIEKQMGRESKRKRWRGREGERDIFVKR